MLLELSAGQPANLEQPSRPHLKGAAEGFATAPEIAQLAGTERAGLAGGK